MRFCAMIFWMDEFDLFVLPNGMNDLKLRKRDIWTAVNICVDKIHCTQAKDSHLVSWKHTWGWRYSKPDFVVMIESLMMIYSITWFLHLNPIWYSWAWYRNPNHKRARRRGKAGFALSLQTWEQYQSVNRLPWRTRFSTFQYCFRILVCLNWYFEN